MGKEKSFWDADGSTGLGFLRREGFASLDAGESEGTLVTRTVQFQGKYLFVNVDAADGQLRAEVLTPVEKYACNPERWTPCQLFEEGQEFVTCKEAPWEMPAGFCGWAWSDMQKLVYGMARGGQDVFVTCCTDGYRPVIFKLEKCVETDPE